MERKAQLIAALGVEALLVLEFDQDISTWPAEAFVRRVLLKGLSAAHAVVGANFTFGHKAKGNLAVLTDLGGAFGFSVEGVPLMELDGRAVSSSSIREALRAGDLEWPARALGRRYSLDGVVAAGAGRGRGLGFPTANLAIPARILLPAEGVYAGKALTGDGSWVAAINVGTNPTFGAEPLHVEAFLLDFEGDLIGQSITLEFWERLRDELRFESPDDLSRQIKEDVERTREVVGS
jgi:riboflavin kinase/FMN adenylyltransferase